MYRAGPNDKVVVIAGFPRMDFGAPLPGVAARFDGLELTYNVFGDVGAPRARVHFKGVMAHYLGWPNEEVIQAHPLYERGLGRGDAFEVVNSFWREEIMIANRAHRYHMDEQFAVYRHFIVTFHDETFECLARSFEVMRP